MRVNKVHIIKPKTKILGYISDILSTYRALEIWIWYICKIYRRNIGKYRRYIGNNKYIDDTSKILILNEKKSLKFQRYISEKQ